MVKALVSKKMVNRAESAEATRRFWIHGKPTTGMRFCPECSTQKPLACFAKCKHDERNDGSFLKHYCTECDERCFPPPCYTYLVRALEVPRVKIGKSFKYKKRFSELKTASPIDIELVEITTDVPEAYFHDNEWLQDYRHHGEWYDLCLGFIEAFEYIVSCTAPCCNFGQIDLRDELAKYPTLQTL